MKVLALTHAHLIKDGLSPVSCERADSVAFSWVTQLKWEVDIVYTSGTQWRGIWPNGKGVSAGILEILPPPGCLLDVQPLFFNELKAHLKKGKPGSALKLMSNRLQLRLRSFLSERYVIDRAMEKAAKWGKYIGTKSDVRDRKYDLIFLTVGYGDEYLLQTAYTLSVLLNIPFVVDFRDLWSDHHEQRRFSPAQKKHIKSLEKKFLERALLISAPGTHMLELLHWTKKEYFHLPHCAFKEDKWADGVPNTDIFTCLYAGKLYKSSEGLQMLLSVIKEIGSKKMYRPFKCLFYIDDIDALSLMVKQKGIEDFVEIYGWVSPEVLWQKLRSAHVLVTYDSCLPDNYPILPTKTVQYAYSGRKILSLKQYPDGAIESFLSSYNAGVICYNTIDAATWLADYSFNKELYTEMPELRADVPERISFAKKYGEKIEEILGAKMKN